MPYAIVPTGPTELGRAGAAFGGGRVYWDYAKVRYIVEALPSNAHATAAKAAAEAAAAAVDGHGSGALAADVRRVLNAGALMRGSSLSRRSSIGSNLPYAAIEHFGGWIRARTQDAYGRTLLYIRPGDIQAAVPAVYHRGKRYLDRVPPVYTSVFYRTFAAEFPR